MEFLTFLTFSKKKNFGGGGGFPTKFFFSGGGIFFGGCLGHPTPPPGGRAGSENDTLLPMAMTCDRLKFWSGPAWQSKVIIRKPWRRSKLACYLSYIPARVVVFLCNVTK